MNEFAEFRKQVLRLEGKGAKRFKVQNSFGVYDAYKKIRKHKWFDIGRPLKEHEFYAIIRQIGDLYADEVSKGNTVIFPSKMGKLELRKTKSEVHITKNGKLKIGYPIDWDSTLNLWFEDAEARENKLVIRYKDEYVFRVKYSCHDANYENKSFYEFALNRFIKRRLKERIKNGEITDALW